MNEIYIITLYIYIDISIINISIQQQSQQKYEQIWIFIFGFQLFYRLIDHPYQLYILAIYLITLQQQRAQIYKMTEKRPWTEDEDRILKYVFQTSKLTKWSHIARKLQEQYGIKGRNGKQCKERYITHVDKNLPKEEWNYQDQQRMFQLHNELGNKWAIIGNKLGNRSDNCVKNHFYSKLRKALRKINKVISTINKKEIKEVKPNILYRIVQASEEKFKFFYNFDQEFTTFANNLKNSLIEYSYDDQIEQDIEQDSISVEKAKEFINKIVQFGNNYKKKTKKGKKDLLTPSKQSKKVNEENQESEGSSLVIHSEQFEDISDDQISRKCNEKKIRKKSDTTLGIEFPRVRTRAYSQDNTIPEYFEQSNKTQELEKQLIKQAQQNQQIEGLLVDLNVLEIQDMPHPLMMMKKETSKYSQMIESEQYHFFQDSEMQMRIFPEIMLQQKKDSLNEYIFHN